MEGHGGRTGITGDPKARRYLANASLRRSMSLVPLRAYPGDSVVHGDTCTDAGAGGCRNM
jgi:hypothetical protein